MTGMLERYDDLLMAGAMDPDHYRAVVRQLCLVHHGTQAAARAERLLGVVALLGRGTRELPRLARLACAMALETPDPVHFDGSSLPGWIRGILADSASWAYFAQDVIVRPTPAGRWLRDDQGGWAFVPERISAALFYRTRGSDDWEPYTPKKGANAGKPMEKNSQTGAIRPVGGSRPAAHQDGPGQQHRDKPRTLDAARAKSRRDNKRGGSQGEDGRPRESKRAREQRERQDGRHLSRALHDIFGGLARRVKEMGAAGWDRLSKQVMQSPEIKELARQIGYRPGRLHGLPGKALEAIADPRRQPAGAHFPLARRGEVPDLSSADTHHPAREVKEKPIPLAEAAKGGLPGHGSGHQKSEAQQKGLPDTPTPRAAKAVREVSKYAERMGEKRVRAAVGKAIEGLSFPEAMHVYRTLIPHKEQAGMPVPRSSREVASAVLRGLASAAPRGDAGALIARDRHAWATASTIAQSLGDQHAQNVRASALNKRQAVEQAKRIADRPGGPKDQQAEEMIQRQQDVDASVEAVAAQGRKTIMASLLGHGDPSKIDAQESEGHDVGQANRDVAAKAVKWLGVVLRDAPTIKVRLEIAPKGRAHAIVPKNPGDPVIIRLRKEGSSEQAIIHELGHAIEVSVPGAKEAATKFLEYRCGNEKMRDMGEVGGRPGEMGRKDNFDKHFSPDRAHYVGKTYKGGETEVISMGLDQMYKDPVGFAKNDPEYFALIHGILSGSGRKEK